MIAQDPGPGSRLAKGATISLIVSTGAGSVIVPDVEGLTQSAAESNLTSRGLNVTVDEDATTDPSEDGRVIDQAPSAGTRVRAGDDVTIVVGSFEEPTDPEEPPPDDETPEGGAPGGAAVKVVVLSGGRSSEHEVSLASGASVAEGLEAAGHEAVPVLIERDGRWVHEGKEVDLRPAGGPARRRRRLPGAARALRRGRQRPGNARGARRPLRRPRACSPPRWRWTS